MTVMYKQYKNWIPMHLSLDIQNLGLIQDTIQQVVHQKLKNTHLKRQWTAVNIVDFHVISSTYQPSKNTTLLDVLVFVADITGEQIDKP
jgi:hypothetical protein